MRGRGRGFSNYQRSQNSNYVERNDANDGSQSREEFLLMADSTQASFKSECTQTIKGHGDVQIQLSSGDQGELKMFYHASWVAFVGGSLLKGLGGHNLAEAAAAGCAVITGPHIGHFSQMVSDFQHISPLSIQQVSGKDELLKTLQEIMGDSSILQARKEAAQRASVACAQGVINKVWKLLELYVLCPAFGKQSTTDAGP